MSKNEKPPATTAPCLEHAYAFAGRIDRVTCERCGHVLVIVDYANLLASKLQADNPSRQ